VSGQRALDALFPGFEQDIVRAGAVPIIPVSTSAGRPGYDPFPRRDLGCAHTPCRGPPSSMRCGGA